MHTVTVRSWDAAGNVGESTWQVTVDNGQPEVRVLPGGRSWQFWETLRIDVRHGCVPVKRLEVRIWEPGTSHERKWVWTDGWQGEQVAVKWNTRWYSETGPYAHAGTYPVSITVWDAWGRQSGVQGEMVVPAQTAAAATPTPEATAAAATATATAEPTPTPTATRAAAFMPPVVHPRGGSPPQALPAGNGNGGSNGPVVVNSTVMEENASPAAPARQPLGNLPLWGGAAAGFLALWAAYARRKRQQRAAEEARERAARAARDAEDRARRQAVIDAVARDLAAAEEDAPAVLPGEVRAEEAFAGNAPPPTYDPERVKAGVAEIMDEKRLNYHDPHPPVDLAAWKQADYAQMPHAREVTENLQVSQPEEVETSWWRRTWHAITHPVDTAQSALISLGRHSSLARQAIVKTAEVVHRVNQALDTTVRWLDAHQSEVSLMVGLTVGTVAVIVTGGGALPLVVALAAAAGITGGMTIGLNAYYGRRWTENLGINLLLGAGGVGVAFVQAWAFQAVMGRVAPPVAARVVQMCQAHPVACGVAQPALWLADKGWNTYDTWQAGQVLKDPEARWEEKWTAGLSLTLAGMSEFLEPDEEMGLNLPLDDLARRKMVAEFQERLEREGAADALDWLRKQIGDEAFQRWWSEFGKERMVGLSAEEAEEVAEVLWKQAGATEALDWLRQQVGEEAFRQWWLRMGEEDVVRVSAGEAKKVAEVLRESGFTQVWVDAASGRVYTSVARPEALEVAQKLAQAKLEGADAEEVQALVRALGRLSARNGEAEVVVLGPWKGYDTEGFYIQQALARNGAFFDMGEAWDLVKQNGIDPWLVNEAFMEEMERQGKRFVHVLDLTDPDEQKALKLALTLPLDAVEEAVRGQLGYVPYRYLEMKWLRQRGYRPVQQGNVIEWINP